MANPSDLLPSRGAAPAPTTASDADVAAFRERLNGPSRGRFDALDDNDQRIVAHHAKATRGRFVWYDLDVHGLVVYGKPSSSAYKAFMWALTDVDEDLSRTYAASHNYCLDCVLYPDRERLAPILEDLPAHGTEAAKLINQLAKGERPKQ